ncbi:MAG: cation:proton antiporter subunit C [Desulfobacterales bacterium]|nr:cation:proton antiporter subunit C [Desulfobacterales bacterium]
MTPPLLYALAGVALFSIGVGGLITAAHLLRQVLSFNVAGSGVFLFLVAMAYRTPGPFPDPVPHAMVLTGIVVAVSATALALLLICIRHESTACSATGEDDRP